MGKSKCEHKKWKQYCRVCSPQTYCAHNRVKYYCGLCGGKGSYRDHIRGARQRGLTTELTSRRYYWLAQQPCTFCGELAGGVDRFKNTHGYTTFNSVPACFVCNSLKSARSAPDFVAHIQKLAAHTTTYSVAKQRWIETRTTGPDLEVSSGSTQNNRVAHAPQPSVDATVTQ